jgi:hypothetical protein
VDSLRLVKGWHQITISIMKIIFNTIDILSELIDMFDVLFATGFQFESEEWIHRQTATTHVLQA